MDNQVEDKVFDLDNIPEDAELFTKQQEFEPIDPSEMYQVELLKVELRENPFYKPDAKKPQDQGSKYQFSFEYAILDDGDFYGRRIWDTTSLAFKPDGKRGATKLYKIVMAMMKLNLDWEECAEFAPNLKTFYKNLLDNIVGKQVRVAIENKTNPETKKTRSKIVSYYEVKKDLDAFDQEKSTRLAEEARAKKNAKPEKTSGKAKKGESETTFP